MKVHVIDHLGNVNDPVLDVLEVEKYHENKPIQIYWKFYHQKWLFFFSDKKNYIFHISAKKL